MTYSLREGFAGLFRAKFSTAIAISVIAISLIIFGLFYIFIFNAQQVINSFRERIELEAFIDNSADSLKTEQIKRRLKSMEGIESVNYVSKEEAVTIFKQHFREISFDILDENPLPASFQIRLTKIYQTSIKAKKLVDQLKKIDGIDEVIYRSDILALLDQYMKIIIIVLSVIGGILLLGSIFLISNTIKLIIFSRLQIIETMKLVGATKRFIRRPFIIEGIVQGVIGSLVAILLLYTAFKIIDIEVPNLLIVNKDLFLILFVSGIVLGFLGSRLAIQRFLK